MTLHLRRLVSVVARQSSIGHKTPFGVRLNASTSNSSGGGRAPLPPTPRVQPVTAVPTVATSTTPPTESVYARIRDRGPVSWSSLFVTAVAAASAVVYYQIEREKRLEQAMGKIVTSESNDPNSGGWTPRPEYLAKRKFVATPAGWFPVEDGFGAPGKPAIGGPWSLVDLNGNLVTDKSFEGKWLLLYFGFARCPDICPSEMLKVARVMDTLRVSHPDLAAQLVPLFVSIDPARDSLQALAAYAKDFHPSYIFLTGAPEQVQRMAKSFRVYFSKADESADGQDYLVDHSIVIYFHDDTGDLADCFTQSMRPSDIVQKVVERMTAVAAQ